MNRVVKSFYKTNVSLRMINMCSDELNAMFTCGLLPVVISSEWVCIPTHPQLSHQRLQKTQHLNNFLIIVLTLFNLQHVVWTVWPSAALVCASVSQLVVEKRRWAERRQGSEQACWSRVWLSYSRTSSNSENNLPSTFSVINYTKKKNIELKPCSFKIKVFFR